MSQAHESDITHRRRVLMFAAAFLALSAAGCKSGMSPSKPSWWTFGGGQAGNSEKLATAPPFDDAPSKEGGVAKPSSMASPYPTTTTPEGYALKGAAQPQVAAAQSPQGPATTDAAPITYGRSPQTAAAPPPSFPSSGPSSAATSPSSATVAPQAGPYATLPASTQGGLPPTPSQALQSETAMPVPRMADSRAAESFATPATAVSGGSAFAAGASASSPPAQPTSLSRYGDVNASRFSGNEFPSASVPTAVPPDSGLPSNSEPATPAFTSPAPAGASPALPSSPPRRRPDPGYRPGGTSSYRPSRAILVGEPAAESAVRTAGFESPADPIRQ